jgi:hypothetical protein
MDETELSDDDINLLISLGVMPDKSKSLDEQLATAQGLRADAMKGPEMRGNYRVQTAANPLEFLAKGIQGYKAGKQIDDLRGQQDVLLNQQTAARQAFLRALRTGKTPEMAEPNLSADSFSAPNLKIS